MTISKKKVPFEDRLEDYIEFDGQWHRVSEGERPLPGNRKILLPYMGIVWMASWDALHARWNLAGANRSRLPQDVELWMPVPDCPEEEQPFDAFTRKPRSMHKEAIT